MAVLQPAEGRHRQLSGRPGGGAGRRNNPEDPAAGTRKVPFARELYIEQDDFREDPPKKFFRLSPGQEVRLKHAYYIRCHEVVKDAQTAAITELRCTYDPASRGGWTPGRPQGARHLPLGVGRPCRRRRGAPLRQLLSVPDPAAEKEGKDFKEYLNPASLEILKGCKVEPGLADAAPGELFQFLRQGYFCADADSTPGNAGLQPQRHPARHLGQDREVAAGEISFSFPRRCAFATAVLYFRFRAC